MTIKSHEIDDTYRAGVYLRQWELVDGFPRCLRDALRVSGLIVPGPTKDDPPDRSALDAQIADNGTLRQALADVEVYERALKIDAQAEPEKFRDDGEGGQVITDDWTRWDQAQADIAGAAQETIALATLRATTAGEA